MREVMLRGRKSKYMPDRNIVDGRKGKERQEESDLMGGHMLFVLSLFLSLLFYFVHLLRTHTF